MALQLGALRDALIEAGASATTANRAAEEVACDNRLCKIEADLTLLEWMLGFNIAISVATLLKLLV